MNKINIFTNYSTTVDARHLTRCQKCGEDISLVKNHSDAQSLDGYLLHLCNKCVVGVLKEKGLYFDDIEKKDILNEIEKKHMTILNLTIPNAYNNRSNS